MDLHEYFGMDLHEFEYGMILGGKWFI